MISEFTLKFAAVCFIAWKEEPPRSFKCIISVYAVSLAAVSFLKLFMRFVKHAIKSNFAFQLVVSLAAFVILSLATEGGFRFFLVSDVFLKLWPRNSVILHRNLNSIVTVSPDRDVMLSGIRML